MHKAFPLPVIKFPLAEEVPTASEESCHCQKKREATAVKIALLLKSRRNCQSKSDDSYANKYKTAQELWAAILKTFGGNEATKKTKKNLLKQQYGNFKAEGTETLEQKKLSKSINDFSRMDECLALVDLGASVNLMPLSVCNKLSLPELSPTYMTLELADQSISRPVRVAEDVFVKVGTFHFPADFVVIDFDADPRVPLILGRSFLKTGRALIDVYEGELTLRVGKEAVTFNLDQNSRYSANYDAMLVNRIDLIT
nr:reverse transcriptase domain-containing protein [Tanacetum cinerariifolium]